MYRIMLADDEGIMLEALKNIISSNFGEECEIATAKTGRAVVELAESFRPDIAFMDIQMPGLNGIQAMKEIQKFNKNTIFIVISAYDRFGYAKEAINLGVLEYLTKPVNKRVVIDVCMKAMKKVDEDRQKRSDDLEIREKLETVIPILESGYLYNILLMDSFHNYNDHYRQFLGIEENYGFMIVVEFGDSQENGVLTNAVGAGVRARKFYPELREIAREFFHCLVGPVMGNRVVLLVPFEKETIDYDQRVHILTKTRNMVYKLETRIDSRFRAGIGRIRSKESLRESYAEAMRGLQETDSHVVHINDIPAEAKVEEECMEELKKQYIQELEQVKTRKEVCRWFEEKTKEIRRALGEDREKQSESVMEKAKAYIRKNFQKDLTLDEVSKIVDISPYYFSKLFKQETGENFIEYLTKVRMKNAETLLLDPSYSIKEVCALSGYGDPNYFSRIFKKYEGVTPSEYRERLG